MGARTALPLITAPRPSTATLAQLLQRATTPLSHRQPPAHQPRTQPHEAQQLVQAKPGITIPQMGQEMGITPNYLYRVLPQLAKEGKVKKTGKGWSLA
jgi:predicted Rossmann fold nucleotide-binding protein DprA/Smf involved in DNA uptake